MDLSELTSIYPTLFFFWAYCLFLLLMIISLITGFLGDIDLPFEIDADIDSGSLSILDLFFPQRLGQLPLLVSLTIVFFIATTLSYLIQDYLLFFTGALYWIIGSITLLVILFLSLHITNIILKPFDRFLRQKHAFATINYIGMCGVIKTTRVDHSFGEITVKDQSGRDDYLNVYCEQEPHQKPLQYGDIALIVSYNPKLQRYLVIKSENNDFTST